MNLDLYVDSWVVGTRASAYYGPRRAILFFAAGIEDPDFFMLLRAEFESIAGRDRFSKAKEPNAVVGLDISMDPFHSEAGRPGTLLSALGTLARLEKQ